MHKKIPIAYIFDIVNTYMCRYFMYYYPWLSFAAGCALVSGVQVLLYLSIAVVSFVVYFTCL